MKKKEKSMQEIKLQTAYLENIVKLRFFPSIKRLKFRLDFLFRDISFKDKNILDIGGGAGIYSFYAACMGAKRVVCLEPEFAGSSKGLKEKFSLINSKLGLNNVYFVPETFQEYEPSDIYDVVISNASINHLNEDSCIKLRESKIAKEEYRNIFRKLSKMTSSGSKLIICDCSNKNLFNLIGLKNPFAPSIEWKKHQSPKVWTDLLEDCGFKRIELRWSSFNRFGRLGNLILGNSVCSYFLTSGFCIWLEKP